MSYYFSNSEQTLLGLRDFFGIGNANWGFEKNSMTYSSFGQFSCPTISLIQNICLLDLTEFFGGAGCKLGFWKELQIFMSYDFSNSHTNDNLGERDNNSSFE